MEDRKREGYSEMESTTTLLRLATAGSVDDGKSTLIGRLLYDSKAVMEDQLAAVEATRANAATTTPTFALVHRRPAVGARAGHRHRRRVPLLRHGQAEIHHRRYPRAHPVHPQHHRRLHRATGDRSGRRPARSARAVPPARLPGLAAGVRHIVLAVNKMDLIRLGRGAVQLDSRRVPRLRRPVGHHDVTTIPMSALNGDNVVTKSDKSPWYEGPALLSHLEDVYIAGDRNLVDVRFPVQYVIRP